jgi:hypothetical protein
MIDFIPRITLTEAMTSPAFFGSVYASPTLWTWRVVAKLIDNIPLIEPREVDLFKECTGRTQLLSTTSKGVLRRYAFLCGRRAAKTASSQASLFGVQHCVLTGANTYPLVSRPLFFCWVQTSDKRRY